LIRIPTGFGKTAGTVLTWLYNRVLREDLRQTWPARLVFCLPMRTLVEQTERTISGWLSKTDLPKRVGLHVLMGGVDAGPWLRYPELPAILVGTQDMLLSRGLNRGYGSGRAAWPMEFGLLHHDALWVLDEVQLMDVGLATSVQLAAFRDQDAVMGRRPLRPVRTWWMSATLQPRWLGTVDRAVPTEPPLIIPSSARKGGLFNVRKTLVRSDEVNTPAAIALCARDRHLEGSLTLIIVNQVSTAIAVHDELVNAYSAGKGKQKGRRPDAPEIRLVHSRFRGAERAAWAGDFLRRKADLPQAGRIIVATQVVEAGVDISAATLVTELAPWSSLVQRFGRAARYEEDRSGTVVVVGKIPAEEKNAVPYEIAALSSAAEGIDRLCGREADASPRSLEAFEEELGRSEPAFLAKLYPYDPLHVLRRCDLDDLFDNSADLSGTDLDVSRFIRSGEERDVRVFWRSFDDAKEVHLDEGPRREELCPVPIGDIRAWKHNAYVLDYQRGDWERRSVKQLVPGMVILLNASKGGYTIERGWDPKASAVEPVREVPAGNPDRFASQSRSEDNDDLSIAPWKTIAFHGRETEKEVSGICEELGMSGNSKATVLALAARWHDAGKAHWVFQDAIKEVSRQTAPLGRRRDLAKAPDGAWRRPDPYPERPGFRHELASALALLEVLRRADPFHAALLGPHRTLLAAMHAEPLPTETASVHPLATEIALLSAEDFDLLLWLVCTHHGKVRCNWTSTSRDQEEGHGGIHGVCEGDELSFSLADAMGHIVDVPAVSLSLDAAQLGVGRRYGASWGERVAGLLATHGPFTLAYLESLLRAADWRASESTIEDPLS
jgi:CRISPR-associated endonuclease/helicase Cas3